MLKRIAFVLCLAASLTLSALPSFDSEIRIGVPGNGNWETGLYNAPGGTLVSNGQYGWVSGAPLSWKLDYNATTGSMTLFYNLVGIVYLNSISEIVANSGALNGLQLWVSSSGNVKATAGVSVSNLVLVTNSQTYTLPNFSITGPSQFQQTYFGVPVTGDFTLTGRTTMTYGSPRPTQSNLTFHVQSVTLPVPEPGTILLLCGMGAVALMGAQRKRVA